MKFKFIETETGFDNDCWCVALSYAFDIDYNVMRKKFKHLIYKDGGVEQGITKGYLKQKGYILIETTLDLKDALRIYNLKNGVIFLVENDSKEHHVIYVKGNKIYDNYDKDMMWWYITNFNVNHVAIKLESYE